MKKSFNYTGLAVAMWLLVYLLRPVCTYAQKTAGLALTPPMGWNSWNTFQTKINEQLIKDVADKLVSSGMAAAGYKFLVLDDGWMSHQRDKDSNLVADPQKFPHGMKALSDYVHSKGLKFGLYNCAGTLTCAGYPGTKGHDVQDARYYASVGIDYLKFDWCHAEGLNAPVAYSQMSKALTATGRPIIFSLCEWGTAMPWHWAAPVGQLWRTTGDIGMAFDGSKKFGDWTPMSAMRIIDIEDTLRAFAGPGHWNDPDMLEVGNGYTAGEDRAHFSMWCMLAAPLMAGNDLRTMPATTLAVLKNADVLGVDQDKMGVQGFRYERKDSLETWFKPLAGGSWAVCFLNRSAAPRSLDVNWKDKGLQDSITKRRFNTMVTRYTVRNLWTHKNAGTTAKHFTAVVPSHDVVMVRLDALAAR